MASLQYNLNRKISGTNGVVIGNPSTWLGVLAAANAWAGTSGLGLVGALNQKASPGRTESAYKGLQGVLNELAGTSGLGIGGAGDLL